MSNSALQIILKRSAVDLEELGWINLTSYPVTVEAFANINLEEDSQIEPNEEGFYPANIFVLQRHGTKLDPNQGDLFVKVATGIDVGDYPSADSYENSIKQDPNYNYAYYRTNKVKLFTNSAEDADQLWTNLKLDAQYLVKDINALLSINADAVEAVVTQSDIIESIIQ